MATANAGRRLVGHISLARDMAATACLLVPKSELALQYQGLLAESIFLAWIGS